MPIVRVTDQLLLAVPDPQELVQLAIGQAIEALHDLEHARVSYDNTLHPTQDLDLQRARSRYEGHIESLRAMLSSEEIDADTIVRSWA